MAAKVRTVAGVELVTIPLADYAELLDCRRQLAETKATRRAFEAPPKSRLERDPELATFAAERFGTCSVLALRAECLRRFGRERTPSQNAFYRYWSRLRGRPPG